MLKHHLDDLTTIVALLKTKVLPKPLHQLIDPIGDREPHFKLLDSHDGSDSPPGNTPPERRQNWSVLAIHYERLGLQPNCTLREVSKKYKAITTRISI